MSFVAGVAASWFSRMMSYGSLTTAPLTPKMMIILTAISTTITVIQTP